MQDHPALLEHHTPLGRGLVCLRDVVPPGERERRFGPVDDAVIVYIICTRTRICVLGQVWVATRKGGGRRVLPRGEVVVFIGPRPRVVVAGGDRMPSREGERRSLLFFRLYRSQCMHQGQERSSYQESECD